jgi:GNAT superfamily N-acetyltransferase
VSADIRELEPGDEALLHRAIRTFKDVDAVAPDLFLEDPRTHAFVALDADQVVGWCFGYELFRPEGRWMMVLDGIDVREEWRRTGVGHELLERFVVLARSKGHEQMWLMMDAGSEVARRLYDGAGEPTEKLGYWWVFG